MSDSSSAGLINRIQELQKGCSLIDIDPLDKNADNLEKWYIDAKIKLEEYYKIQKRRISEHSGKLKEEIQRIMKETQSIQSSIAEQSTTNDETFNILKVKLEQMGNDLKQIGSDFQVEIRPFEIENFIEFKEYLKLSHLLFEPSSIVYTENSSPAIAANDKYLLIHLEAHICLLNHRNQIVKMNLWTNDFIRDMCWSTKLNSFIVLTNQQIFEVNENLEISNRFPQCDNRLRFSCTCSDDILYLSMYEYGSSVFSFDLTSFETIQEWKSPLTCEKNEGIIDIQYNNNRIALAVYHLDKKSHRIVLKSAKNFETLWSCPIGDSADERLATCCPINNDQWIFVNGSKRIIGHLSADGKYISKLPTETFVYRAVCLGKHRLAIAFENSIVITQLKPII